MLSNNSAESSQQSFHRASTFSGPDTPSLAVLRNTSVSSSVSSLPSGESTRRHSTATASSDSGGTVVDTTARQPVAEPAATNASHTPNTSSVSPQSCPTYHRRNFSIGSRCSSAYSTMSDTDRRILQHLKLCAYIGVCVHVCMCVCARVHVCVRVCACVCVCSMIIRPHKVSR